MTAPDLDEAANTLLACIAAVFKQLKSRDPAAHPWVGAMLATEHLRQMGTSVFIQITRRGIDPPAAASHGSAPAAQTALDTAKATAKRPGARTAPAKRIPTAGEPFVLDKGDSFICPQCDKAKVWRMDWPGNPKSVCIDCYKAGRQP